MKENKGVSVPKHYMKHTERIYELYSYRTQDDRRYVYGGSKDVACQYESRRTDISCACRNGSLLKRRDMYFSGLPKQVYAYHGTRSVTDVGVGSVKAFQRKRVKRIYLPETDDRGIGSEDLTAFVTRRSRPIPKSYYDEKKTSSKCVGGVAEYKIGGVLSEKLSPIVQTRSEATSPSNHTINTEMASNTIGKDMVTIPTQVESDLPTGILDNPKQTDNPETTNTKITANDCSQPTCSKDEEHITLENIKVVNKKNNQVDKGVSSDSLVQHVHNLENPSHLSVDPMENKLEREYRKMFTTKPKDKKRNDKPGPEMKSTSILRRRFEALRRGTVKKEDSMKDAVIENQEPNQPNPPIRKDVSIASDPPSLEGRSYSNTKIYSPFHMKTGPEKSICKASTSRKKSSEKKDKDSLQWCQMGEDDSDCQGVKGMFKLWGKKFNLDEDGYKKRSTPMSSYSRVNTFTKEPDKKAELKLEKAVKKDGKKFFFFNKKSKEKPKPYKSKKGLTAGRCEVGEGLMIKIDANTHKIDSNALHVDEPKEALEISNEILRQQWLSNYLTRAIESKNSVQIRWNNNIYATSSSTVFELMDTVYQGTGIVFRSKSEIMTGESSFYRSRTQHVNFAHQEIEAWMIPEAIIDPPKKKRLKPKRASSKHNTEVKMLAQKWFIDKAKAFSRKIEVVLHTKNVLNNAKDSSSEYLRIDIPKDFFIESSSDENRKPSSDEEVFKIVEYETASDLKRNNKNMDTGDHPIVDHQFIVKKRSNFEPNILETVIKKPPVQRSVLIQVSEVNIQKPCDVIGVGIITQKDLREIRKPILKIQETLTDEESTHILTQNHKKCEFAESYLQDSYRHWTPLGIDLLSWCYSDSHLRCNSQSSFHNQGDGSKSCFNIYDGFQTSAVLSSNNNECEPCAPSKVIPNQEHMKTDQENSVKSNWFKKLKKKKSIISDSAKRSAPKDSLEVYKKRKLYAESDKSKWANISYCDMPGVGDKEPGDAKAADTKLAKANLQKKPCRKHVSLKEDGTYQYVSKSECSQGGILMFKGASGCDVCKEATGICPKHATVDPVSCEIPDPPCKTECVVNPNPPCSSKVPKKVSPPPICVPPEKSNESSNGAKLNATSQTECVPCNPEQPTTVLCPHFPPCRVSQSCQKSLESLQNCPGKCPPDTQIPKKKEEDNKPPPCNPSTCQSKKSNEMKTCPKPTETASSPCQKPACPAGSDEFPWPLKSQHSCQSILKLPACSPCISKCSSNSQSPQASNNSLTLNVKNVQSPVESKPKCASPPQVNVSKRNSSSDSPAPQATLPIQECVSPQPKNCSEIKANLTKEPLTINSPQKKTCSKADPAMDATMEEPGVIRLSSKERITISMKETTPSTEEIREGMNIKVRDDDGNTLYERRDFKKGERSRPSVLGDVYKASINRISTPIIVKNIQTSQERAQPKEKEIKSNTSIGNVIEIQFQLKIKPGDEVTEMNTEKNKNMENVNKSTKSDISTVPQSVYVVKNSEDGISAKSSAKNDVSIRIVIKNLKSKSDKKKNIKYNEDFSKKISNKFHTVSTGYSDVYTGENMDKGLSIHRATIDLTDSNGKSTPPTQPSENKTKVEFKDQEPYAIASWHEKNPSQSKAKMETDFITETSYSTERLNYEENVDVQSDIPDEEVRPTVYTDSEDQDNFDTIESGIIIPNSMNKEQKKEMLKKIFEKANNTKVKTKDKMKQLRDMLKVVLTSDSSGHDEMAVTSNELLKDLTFASFKPDLFKDTDSINDGYNIDSILSLGNKNEPKYYPTEEQNSEYSKSEDEEKAEPEQGCMCRTFADRLQMCNFGGGGCCCRGNRMISEEVSCDIKVEDDFLYMEDKTVETVDVDIQNSKYSTGDPANKKLSLIQNNPEILAQFGEITSRLCQHETVTTKSPIDVELPYDSSKIRNSKVLDRNIALNISDEDRKIILNATPTNVSTVVQKSDECKTRKMLTASDILQSYAMKKAVLEIYAEKTVDENGEHMVAKLPKFVYDRESEICRYQEKLCHYQSICKKNIVMMSVQR